MQRVRALDLFLHDVYHEQRILRERVGFRPSSSLVPGTSGGR